MSIAVAKNSVDVAHMSGRAGGFKVLTRMTRQQRLAAAFRGAPVDRVPISFWQHFPGQDHESGSLAAATIHYQRRFDLDFVKLMPTGMYSVRDYGVTTKPSDDEIGTTRFANGPIRRPEDWGQLPSVPPHAGILGEQVKVIRLVRDALGPEVPVLQTIFSPLTMAVKVVGGDLGLVLCDQETLVRRALDRLADDVVAFGEACLAAGADGFFFATQLATRMALPPGAYERLGLPYDLKVLAALRPRSWALIFHLHGVNPLFDLVNQYPIDGVNWHARETTPSLASALPKTEHGLIGGIARMGPVVKGSPEDVIEEVHDAIAQTQGRRLVVAPSCVLPTTSRDENLAALRLAVESS